MAACSPNWCACLVCDQQLLGTFFVMCCYSLASALHCELLATMAEATSSHDVPKLLIPDLNNEHPLDYAMRTNNRALRCYFEEHGYRNTQQTFHTLTASQRKQYERIPRVAAPGLAAGLYYVRTYDGKVQEITAADAAEHPMFAFQSA